MNQTILNNAAKLAHRHYRYDIRLDQTTSGEPIYFATCLDLEGCHAQGETLEEALRNLTDARTDFIYSLLEDNLPVPDPTPIGTASTVGAASWEKVVIEEKDYVTFTVYEFTQQS